MQLMKSFKPTPRQRYSILNIFYGLYRCGKINGINSAVNFFICKDSFGRPIRQSLYQKLLQRRLPLSKYANVSQKKQID